MRAAVVGRGDLTKVLQARSVPYLPAGQACFSYSFYNARVKQSVGYLILILIEPTKSLPTAVLL